MSQALLAIISLALGAYAQKSSCFSSIDWKPCPNAAKGECGFYQIPLDYAHPEVGNATLAVARIRASKQPRLGTLFTNPGGPSASGVSFVLGETGELISNLTNHQYDVVSWDPRGVNQTKPSYVSCGFTTQADSEQFWNTSISDIPGVIVEARGNFTDQDDLDAFYAGLNETDAKLEQFGQKCMDSDGAFLKYLGTAAVVRDMVSLSDCLEGQGQPVNYWGFSYGTVIGNYFVNMFPERVGRVIIDGIEDSITWATEPSFKSFATVGRATENVFAGFTQKCAEAGPPGCAFAKNDSSPASLALEIRTLINATYDLHKAGRSALSAYELRSDIFGQLYTPHTWAEGFRELQSIAETITNETAINATSGAAMSLRMHSRVNKSRRDVNTSHGPVDPIVQEFLTQVAITCVDSVDQNKTTTKQVFDELVRLTHKESPMFGEVLSSTGFFYCHRFPARAVERFTGPFNHTLAYPIIVIGNEADPITPFVNAQKIAKTLGSSAHLLKQNGFGHTSTAENSDCTHGVIRDYFLYGKLPSAGQVCEVNDNDLFPTNGNSTTA